MNERQFQLQVLAQSRFLMFQRNLDGRRDLERDLANLRAKTEVLKMQDEMNDLSPQYGLNQRNFQHQREWWPV